MRANPTLIRRCRTGHIRDLQDELRQTSVPLRTSLSKGFGLIQRFSEDLDFKVLLPEGEVNRSRRRKYRQQLIDAIEQQGSWRVPRDHIERRNESRFFSCRIDYDPVFQPAVVLRPHVKLEVSFRAPALPTQARPVQSFITQAEQTGPEVDSIACVSPAETAADKLSALTWRVLTRERGSERDDPTLIRHLHDLASLEAEAAAENGFSNLLYQLLEQDADRGTLPANRSDLVELQGTERVKVALDLMAQDPEYAREYEDFVMSMSYAADPGIPSFKQALEAAYRLKEYTTNPKPPGPN